MHESVGFEACNHLHAIATLITDVSFGIKTRQRGPAPVFSRLSAAIDTVDCPRTRSQPRYPKSRGELVRQTVAHEVAAANRTTAKHMFLSQKQDAKGLPDPTLR